MASAQANLPAKIQPEFGSIAVGKDGVAANNLAELKQFSLLCLQSGWAGSDAKTAEHVMMKVIMGRTLGLPDLAALQNISIINNRPCLWGDSMRAVVEASGCVEYITETIEGTGDNITAVCEVKRKDRTKAHTARFSMADARAAGLVGKGTWKSYPRRMLQLRARSFALRDQFADKLCGVYMAEEMQDVAPAKETIVSGDVVPPQDLDAAAELLDQDQPAVIDEPDFGNSEDAEFAAAAHADAIANGDAEPEPRIGRGPGEVLF